MSDHAAFKPFSSMYGPPDNQLDESLHDKNKELRIVETYLVPRVEQFRSVQWTEYFIVSLITNFRK